MIMDELNKQPSYDEPKFSPHWDFVDNDIYMEPDLRRILLDEDYIYIMNDRIASGQIQTLIDYRHRSFDVILEEVHEDISISELGFRKRKPYYLRMYDGRICRVIFKPKEEDNDAE